jgi:hypothetical protein
MIARAVLFFGSSEAPRMQTTNFLQLSIRSQFLIRLCQRVNYGSILNVQVTDGDVCFDSPPDVVLDVRLDGDVTQRH